MSSPANPPPARPPWLLRRTDQAVVAVLVLVSLVATVGWWVAQGGLQGRLIELDRSEPLTASFEVDVNQAQWAELAQLPGIGPTLAQRIVEYRENHGPFFDHAQLRRVRGIGPKTLEAIRPYLRPLPDAAGMAADTQ